MYFGLAVLAGLCLSFVEVGFAFAVQAFLSALGVASSGKLPMPEWVPVTSLRNVLLFLLGVSLLKGLLQWAQYHLHNLTGIRFKHHLRTRLIQWALRSPSASGAEVTNYFGEWTNQGGIAINYLLVSCLYATTGLVLGVILLVRSPVTTMLAGLGLGILVFPIRYLGKVVHREGGRLQGVWGHSNARITRNIQNLLLLRIYGRAKEEHSESLGLLNQHLRGSLGLYASAGVGQPLTQFVGVVLIAGIAVGSQRYGTLSPGELVAYFYLFIRMLQSLSNLAGSFAIFNFNRPGLNTLYSWCVKTRDESHPDPKSSLTRRLAPGPIGWRLKEVSFGYGEERLLERLNLEIRSGEAVVLVGPSGGGKTTLLKLLVGELEPREGSIDLVAGGQEEPLRESRSELQSALGYVGPDCPLIEGSVLENLRYSLREAVSLEDIQDAVRMSEADFIDEDPRGLSRPLTEQGQGLSAGQKQRLSLARALLRRPRVLLLDEPTANLDLATEARLLRTLENLKGKMTLVIVSHRDAVLRIADRCLGLEGGKLIPGPPVC